MATRNLGPEEFIIRLFDQVKESSDKNSESIDNLTNAITELVRESNYTLKKEEEIYGLIKKHVEETKELTINVESFMENIRTCINDNKKAIANISIEASDVKELNENTEEVVKSVNWIKGKLKMILTVAALFFVITGLAYTVIRYTNENQTVTEIQKVIEGETERIMDVIQELHPDKF